MDERTPRESLHERLRVLLPEGDAATDRSPLALAYVGDAVFSLAVRAHLVAASTETVGDLHRRTEEYVRAAGQAQALERIEPFLTDAERDVVRRGRNAKSHVPRSSTVQEYRYSTAFEALVGHLFLSGQVERLVELLCKVIVEGDAEA